MSRLRIQGFGGLLIVLALCVFSGNSDAQTRKAKPKPLATPPPATLSDAEIISEAGDYDPQQKATPVDRAATGKSTSPKTTANNTAARRNLDARIKKLEASQQSDYETKQKMLLLNLDILTRAEARSESLRKQLFELIDKENSIKARLDQIEIDIQPEAIERTLQLVGSMKPEEVRESKRKSLDAERTNLNTLLTTVELSRANLAASLQKSDELVEKLRTRLEKDIDTSLDAPSPSEKPDDEQ